MILVGRDRSFQDGLNYRLIFLPRSTVAALARLLATVIAPLTAQLSEVTQPLAIRFGWYVAVPDFLFGALTRPRTRAGRGTSGGPQTTAITAIQASYGILAITGRHAHLVTTVSP